MLKEEFGESFFFRYDAKKEKKKSDERKLDPVRIEVLKAHLGERVLLKFKKDLLLKLKYYKKSESNGKKSLMTIIDDVNEKIKKLGFVLTKKKSGDERYFIVEEIK